jgi:hypothetical protein
MSRRLSEPVFSGPGPFATPLIARFETLQVVPNPDGSYVTGIFVFEDGRKVHVRILIQAAVEFAEVALAAKHSLDNPRPSRS